jgi:glycosyltransferase involved in cell wall biosynthesis
LCKLTEKQKYLSAIRKTISKPSRIIMRILFLHSNFPAQFRHLATALAQDPQHQVVFGSKRAEGSLPGVHKALYTPSRSAHLQTHRYVRSLESAVLEGQAVYRMGQALKAQGFIPDVVYGHSGWGTPLFIKDLFPKARLCGYFEWYYRAHGSDADFDPSEPLDADAEAKIRMMSAPILMDLVNCDRGISPTQWQQQQFPIEFHSKLKVLHDGIDTTFFRPNPRAKLVLPGLDLSQVDEIVTYATRGMEPYRGFPQFMEAAALIQQRRPNCHVVVAGDDRVAYGKSLPDGKTYKQLMLEKLPLDLSRLHFTGSLPYDQYLRVLQASSAHIYLTRPFVLSWSMLEAMASGCLVIGSNTTPVAEVIKDGKNGLLVDFFSPTEIADRVDEVLEHGDRLAHLRANARETILKHYDLATLLPQQIQWLLEGLQEPNKLFPKAKGFAAKSRFNNPAFNRKHPALT